MVTRAAIGASGTKIFEQRYPAAGERQCRGLAVRAWTPTAANRVKIDLGR